MDVILNAGDSVKIPENCTVVERDGMAFFEPVKPKFKRGDFVWWSGNNPCFAIVLGKCKSFPEDSYNCFSLYKMSSRGVSMHYKHLRLATDSEKQLLLDKLHENGKDWDAEKYEIVDLKYVPKVGDCLRLECSGEFVYIECSGLQFGKYPCGYKTIIDNEGIYENNMTNNGWTGKWEVTKITREELQAEFNKLGYEYNFETHTAKKIEWKPKVGETYYTFDGYMDLEDFEWDNSHFDNKRLENGSVFRTRELAEAALELLKNAKHY